MNKKNINYKKIILIIILINFFISILFFKIVLQMLLLNSRYLIIRTIKSVFHKYILDYSKKKTFCHFLNYYFFIYTKRNIFFFYFKNILKQIRKVFVESKKKPFFLQKNSNEQTKIVKTKNLNYIEFYFFYCFRKLNNSIGFFLFKPNKNFFQISSTIFRMYSPKLNNIAFAFWSLSLIEKKNPVKTTEKRIFKKILNYLELPTKLHFFSNYIYKTPNISKTNYSQQNLIYKNCFVTLFRSIKKKIMAVNIIPMIFYIDTRYKISKYVLLDLEQKNYNLNLLIVFVNYLSLRCVVLIKENQFLYHVISNCIFIKFLGALNKRHIFTSYFNYLKIKNIQIHKNFLKNILFIFGLLLI
nr:hypothetical protein Cry52Nrm2_p145 [Cryptomonas curvata]